MAGNFTFPFELTNGTTADADEVQGNFDIIKTNFTPAGLDDASADLAAMQTTADPNPSETASLATSTEGELQRIRYAIQQIINNSNDAAAGHWYQFPDIKTKIAAYSVAITDRVLLGDAIAAAFAFTLPSAVGYRDKMFYFEKIDTSVNAITLAATTVTKSITGAADNGSGRIRVTATAHGRSTNDAVVISGVVGTTEANGKWTVTKVDDDTLDLNGSTFTNAYTSGGTITTGTISGETSITLGAQYDHIFIVSDNVNWRVIGGNALLQKKGADVASANALILGSDGNYFDITTTTSSVSGAADNGAGLIRITATAHGLTTGDSITIDSVVGTTEANGKWTATVVDTDNIDLDGSTFANAYTSGGTVTTNIKTIASRGDGKVVKLHFDAALTLIHNATDLFLTSEADITTAAGDEAEFTQYADGDWRCTNYSKADGTAVSIASISALQFDRSEFFVHHECLVDGPEGWTSGGTLTPQDVSSGRLRLDNTTTAYNRTSNKIFSLADGDIVIEAKIAEVAGAGNPFFQIGLDTSAVPGGAADSVMFVYESGTSKIRAQTSASSTSTLTDTDEDLGTTMKILKIVASTTEVKFYIDGDLKGTHTTNIPTALMYGYLGIVPACTEDIDVEYLFIHQNGRS